MNFCSARCYAFVVDCALLAVGSWSLDENCLRTCDGGVSVFMTLSHFTNTFFISHVFNACHCVAMTLFDIWTCVFVSA
jgi:hypothetical protein